MDAQEPHEAPVAQSQQPQQPPAQSAAAPAPPLPPPEAPQLPPGGQPDVEFCLALQRAMLSATWAGVHAAKEALPPQLLLALVRGALPLLDKTPTLVELRPSAAQQRVTVVGDTHGQYHDVCKLFDLFGHPSSDRVYIFNGDYVDRGAWGVETLALLLAWKWALPAHVHLLRGNHETSLVTRIYGFAAELKAKYGQASRGVFAQIRRLFASMPLAALVEGNTLILHGGLFRAPPPKAKGKGAKRRRSSAVEASLVPGTLDDLRKAGKGGQDPDPERSARNVVATDVLWSDPVNTPGLRPNDARGCGTIFGPDVTQQFLSQNGLRLVIRSHEGPDARDKRLEGELMPPIDSGYSVDHQGPSGRLVTLFSAPDYPQFMAEGEERYHNRGAVLHLSAPDWATPAVESFEAVLPRPQVESYYDVPGYEEEEEEEGEGEEIQGQQQQQQQHGAGKQQAADAAAAPATAGGASRTASGAAAAPAAAVAAAAAAAEEAAAAVPADAAEGAARGPFAQQEAAPRAALPQQPSASSTCAAAAAERLPAAAQPGPPCAIKELPLGGDSVAAPSCKQPTGGGAEGEGAGAGAAGRSSDSSTAEGDGTRGDEPPAKRLKASTRPGRESGVGGAAM